MDFVIGGLAGVGAGFFSNPFDVVKTRMQLQGELQAKGKHAVHYKNTLQAMFNIIKFDGIMSLQRGLVPALLFQWVVNGVRLGLYQQADNFNLLRDKNGQTKFLNSVFFGAVTGAVGATFGCPFQLVKTQLMSYSDQRIAVGTQHRHKGMLYAFKTVYEQSGIAGLWRGVHGFMLRNSIGSSAQIVSYETTKEWLTANNVFPDAKYTTTFAASNVGALVKTIALTPMDVIMTRLFNQSVDAKGKGELYSGVMDCASKITKTEGLWALYKGFGPSYFRQAPHSVLLLVFWDLLKDLHTRFVHKKS